MATAVKRLLSGSTDGKNIQITASADPGNLIHTAVASTTAGTYDEIWLAANLVGAQGCVLVLEFGGNSGVDLITYTLTTGLGLVPILNGMILQNSEVVRAYCSLPNYVGILGFVNSITD